MENQKNAYRIMNGRPFGKLLFGSETRKWENNIKIDLREIINSTKDVTCLHSVTLLYDGGHSTVSQNSGIPMPLLHDYVGRQSKSSGCTCDILGQNSKLKLDMRFHGSDYEE
jgi:hypothetical protein